MSNILETGCSERNEIEEYSFFNYRNNALRKKQNLKTKLKIFIPSLEVEMGAIKKYVTLVKRIRIPHKILYFCNILFVIMFLETLPRF